MHFQPLESQLDLRYAYLEVGDHRKITQHIGAKFHKLYSNGRNAGTLVLGEHQNGLD
jgi:hypothetical protein